MRSNKAFFDLTELPFESGCTPGDSSRLLVEVGVASGEWLGIDCLESCARSSFPGTGDANGDFVGVNGFATRKGEPSGAIDASRCGG